MAEPKSAKPAKSTKAAKPPQAPAPATGGLFETAQPEVAAAPAEAPVAKPETPVLAPVEPAAPAPAPAPVASTSAEEAPAKAAAKPRKAAAKPGPKADAETPDPATVQKMIEEAAYYLAEKRNFEPGFEQEDWETAKASVLAQLGQGE